MPAPSIALSAATAGEVPAAGEHTGHGSASPPGNVPFSGILDRAMAVQAGTVNHATPSGTASGRATGLPGDFAAGVPHPGHFPIGLTHGKGHAFQQKMLGLRAYRQHLIASNIANADTPGLPGGGCRHPASGGKHRRAVAAAAGDLLAAAPRRQSAGRGRASGIEIPSVRAALRGRQHRRHGRGAAEVR